MLNLTASEDKPSEWWWQLGPYSILCILFFALTWPVLFSGQGGDATLASALQRDFHLPVIRTMISQWPQVDIVDYNAAQAPGYHLLLSFVGVYVSDNVTTLKFVSNLLSLGLLLTVFHYARSYAGPWLAMAFVLPLLGSRYFLESAIWLASDDTSLLFASLALGGVVFHMATPFRSLQWGFWAMSAVAVRQYYIAVVIPIGLAGLISSPFAHRVAQLIRADSANTGPWRNWTNFGVSLISLAMPLALGFALFRLWDGLVPPIFQDYHRGPNFAIIPLGLTLIGIYGFFFLQFLLPQLRLLRLADKSLWVVILGGLVISLMWPTAFGGEASGAGGVIWELVHLTPSIGERSVILVPLTIGGAVILFLTWRSAVVVGRGYPAALLIVAIFAFSLALSANRLPHQRYVEPTMIVALVWLISLTITTATSAVVDAGKSRFTYLGPACLGAIQLSIAFVLLYRRVLLDG